ncbi:hypothetical protein CVT91_08140 [Candidatus Atribacteria bacterium HGW-Atribacteria-1]|nr:MAG: hypothetical protein CVT91_08140 [Candidatus Atribacteria bacterium HGW-Atribacteria-1]
MKILTEKILIVYLIIGIAITHLLPLPETIKGFIGMFSFLVIPYLVGNIFFQIKILKEWSNKIDIIGYSFVSWLVGNVLIAMVMTSLYALNMFDIFWFAYGLVISLVLFYIYYFYNKRNKNITSNHLIIKNTNIKYISLLLVVSLSVILFMLYFNPFPLWLEWDFFLGHNIIAHYITDLNQIFRTFAYIDIVSIIVAIDSYLFNHDSFTNGWMIAHFILPFIFFLGMYYFLIAFKIKKEIIFLIILSSAWIFATKETGGFFLAAPKTLIFLAAPFVLGILKLYILPIVSNKEIKKQEILFSIFIFIFTILFIFSIMSNKGFYLFSLGPIHYIYISLILIMFSLIALILLKNKKNLIKDYYLFLFTIIFGLVFIHIIMGLLWCSMIILIVFFMFLSDRYPIKNKIFLIIFSILTLMIILLQNYGLINISISNLLIPDTTALSFFAQDFSKRFDMLINMWPLVFWLFFFIGAIFILFKSVKSFIFPLEIFLVGIIIFLFILDVGVFRLITLIYILAILYVAVGIQLVYDILLSWNTVVATNKISKSIFYLIIAIIFLIPTIGMSISYINGWTSGGGNYSAITQWEYDAGNWIKNNQSKPENTIIISDPRTQFYVYSFSHNRIMPALETLPMDNYIFYLLLPEDSAEIYNRISIFIKNESLTKYHGPCVAKMPDICISDFSDEWVKREPNITSAIVLIDGRTVEWMNRKEKAKELFLLGTFFKIDKVSNADKFLNKFSNKTYFTLLYNNSEIYIFGVNPEPGVPFKIQNNSK